MEYINKVELQGRICGITEIKHHDKRGVIMNVSVEYDFGPDENAFTQTSYHNVQAWKSEKLKIDGLKKGDGIHIIGRVHTLRYVKDGKEGFMNEVIASELTKIEEGER